MFDVKSGPDRELVAVDGDPKLGKRLFAVYVADDSMIANPPAVDVSFEIGDVVVFDRDAELAPGDFCLATIPGYAEPVFRKYRARASGTYELVPLNSDYPSETTSDAGGARIRGRLVRHIRAF